jgi:hypothetical protein
MKQTIQYVVDDRGNKMSVIVPFQEWKILNNHYQKLQAKYSVLMGIEESLKEIKQASKEGRKLQTLTDFLYENGS